MEGEATSTAATLRQLLHEAGVSPLTAFFLLLAFAVACILVWRIPDISRARTERRAVQNAHMQEMLRIRKRLDDEDERRKKRR